MDLEEIITAAVEKRIADIVNEQVNRRQEYASDRLGETELRPTPLEQVVGRMIDRIAAVQVTRHQESIKAAIEAALAGAPVSFEISAYTKIKVPPKKQS